MNQKLTGVTVPVITPFADDGTLQTEWLRHNLRIWTRSKIKGLMVLGTNGEFRAIDDAESRSVIDTAIEEKGDKTLIVGAGRESLLLTQRFIDSISDRAAEIDYLSILPSHYFAKAMTDDALIAYYEAVADSSPVPLLLYVAPGYSNQVVLSPGAVAALADHPNIAGIKDTSTDKLTSYMVAAGGRSDFSVMSGTMGTIMTNLLFGGPGGVVSAANYFPAECAEIVELYHGGSVEKSVEDYRSLQKLIGRTGGKGGVAGVKATMNELGYRAGVPRLPVRPLSVAARQSIREALIAGGKLDVE